MSKKIVIFIIIAILSLASVIGADCKQEQEGFTQMNSKYTQQQKQVSFIHPTNDPLPEEIRDWAENSLKFNKGCFANARELDGKQYFFIASGATGSINNHFVKITDIAVVEQKEVVVKVKFTKLHSDQSVIQVPGNLYDLVYIEATGLQARFVPTSDDKDIYITSLRGIKNLPVIVAQSQSIKVFAPAPNDIVGHKFSVSGAAFVFEGTIVYRLLDAKRNKRVEDATTASALTSGFAREAINPNTTINWQYFTFDLTVPEDIIASADIILELYSESPKDGSETELVAIPLKLN